VAKPCPQWLDDKRQPISVAVVKSDSNSGVNNPINPIDSPESLSNVQFLIFSF